VNAKLTALFRANTTDTFTVVNSGFQAVPPIPYGLGWNGRNRAGGSAWDTVSAINGGFGPKNDGFKGTGAAGRAWASMPLRARTRGDSG
jgi:hypothetical protein